MLQGLILATLALIAPRISGLAFQTHTANGKDIVARAPEPTPAPNLALMQSSRKIVRREVGQICGYANGDKDDPVGCQDGYDCFFWPNIPIFSSAPAIGTIGAVNCIPTDISSSSAALYYPPTTCQDYQGGKYNTGKDLVIQSQTVYCGSDATKCAVYYFASATPGYYNTNFPESSSLAANQDYTQPFCNSKKTTITVYPTPN